MHIHNHAGMVKTVTIRNNEHEGENQGVTGMYVVKYVPKLYV